MPNERFMRHHYGPSGYVKPVETAQKESSERTARRYGIVAELFKTSTGFIAPGFSVPPDIASEQYETDRIHAWNHWTDTHKADAAINMIIFLQEEADEYDQLYAALETCDTNQIRQERDALRLRIKAVDEEHVQLAEDRKKMVETYTIVEMDRNLWKREHGGLMFSYQELQRKLDIAVSTAQEQVAKAREERDFYEKRWKVRGKALEMPCMNCGSSEKAIRLKNGEIP